MEPSITLKGKLFDLKQRFVQTMPDRIAAIASTLAVCVDRDQEATERLERQFHTLAGTAGTYDLNAVAAAAFEGEEACRELNQSGFSAEDLTYMGFLVDQLRGALAVDAPGQWTARTVLTAADAEKAPSGKTGSSAA